MATLDWSQCPAVESVPGTMSGAWVFRGTRMPVSAVFENLEDGLTIDELAGLYDGLTEEQVAGCRGGPRPRATLLLCVYVESGEEQCTEPALMSTGGYEYTLKTQVSRKRAVPKMRTTSNLQGDRFR